MMELSSEDEHHHHPKFPTTFPGIAMDMDFDGEFRILLGRSKEAFHNPGNLRFRQVIQNSVERYHAAPNRKNKTLVVHLVYKEIVDQGGRFFKDSGQGNEWVEVLERVAKDKIGHALRDSAFVKNLDSEDDSHDESHELSPDEDPQARTKRGTRGKRAVAKKAQKTKATKKQKKKKKKSPNVVSPDTPYKSVHDLVSEGNAHTDLSLFNAMKMDVVSPPRTLRGEDKMEGSTFRLPSPRDVPDVVPTSSSSSSDLAEAIYNESEVSMTALEDTDELSVTSSLSYCKHEADDHSLASSKLSPPASLSTAPTPEVARTASANPLQQTVPGHVYPPTPTNLGSSSFGPSPPGNPFARSPHNSLHLATTLLRQHNRVVDFSSQEGLQSAIDVLQQALDVCSAEMAQGPPPPPPPPPVPQRQQQHDMEPLPL